MKNEISTKLVKLDLKTILDNYREPEFWSKKWEIYRHDDITIEFFINYIDVRNNEICVYVVIPKKHFKFKKIQKEIDDCWYSYQTVDCFNIPINNKEYRQEHFERKLLRSVINNIYYLEKQLIEQYGEYKVAKELHSNYIKKIQEEANEFLDKNNVSNKVIREAYVESCVDNANIPNYEREVLDNFKYKVIPYEYLLAISYFNDDAKYEEYKKLCLKGKRKSIGINLWKKGRELDTEEFVETLKANFEPIN